MRAQVRVGDLKLACTQLEAKLEARTQELDALLPLKDLTVDMSKGGGWGWALLCVGCDGCVRGWGAAPCLSSPKGWKNCDQLVHVDVVGCVRVDGRGLDCRSSLLPSALCTKFGPVGTVGRTVGVCNCLPDSQSLWKPRPSLRIRCPSWTAPRHSYGKRTRWYRRCFRSV